MDWLSRQLLVTHADLAEERNLLNKLLLSLDAGVTYLNTDLIYQIVNPYFAGMFGLKPEDFLGKKLFALYPETAGQLGPAFDKALTTGMQQSLKRFALSIPGQGRDTTYWNTSITPIFDDHRKLMGLLTLCWDVTDTVLLERSNQSNP